MSRRTKIDRSRDGGGFVALPWSVLDSNAYQGLSHPAKALLLEVARQYVRDNNGALFAGMAYLRPRGWTSADVVTRAKRELIDAGLLFETVKGHRPNKASWYALTWFALDRHDGFDPGAASAFERGAYRKNDPLIPSHGTSKATIAPPRGIEKASPIPGDGAIRAVFGRSPIPGDGNHLDKPSAAPKSERLPNGYGAWLAPFAARLAALGPTFKDFFPVALPAAT